MFLLPLYLNRPSCVQLTLLMFGDPVTMDLLRIRSVE